MVEHAAVNRVVVGSSPTSGAIFIGENDTSLPHRTNPAQILPDSAPKSVRFPKTIRHHKSEVVICGKRPAYPFCRISWKSGGKRQMRSLRTDSEALAEAERKVRELSAGDQTCAWRITVHAALGSSKSPLQCDFQVYERRSKSFGSVACAC